MAAVGMSRTGDAWVPALDDAQEEEEALSIVKQLVAAGVDLEAKDKAGNTALAGARLIGYESVAQFLVHSGAKQPPAPAARGEDRRRSAERPAHATTMPIFEHDR